jgi:hypothetical protein
MRGKAGGVPVYQINNFLQSTVRAFNTDRSGNFNVKSPTHILDKLKLSLHKLQRRKRK